MQPLKTKKKTRISRVSQIRDKRDIRRADRMFGEQGARKRHWLASPLRSESLLLCLVLSLLSLQNMLTGFHLNAATGTVGIFLHPQCQEIDFVLKLEIGAAETAGIVILDEFFVRLIRMMAIVLSLHLILPIVSLRFMIQSNAC